MDFNQLVIATIFADHALVGACRTANDDSKRLIKHMILNCIRSYKKKFGAEFGDIVICADGKRSWRKDYFQYYKAKRQKGRDESPIDFDFVFSVMGETLDELRESFPYPVIKLDGCEGDDIIAVLTEDVSLNQTEMRGLFEVAPSVLVLSSDKDFVQLQKFDNVKQYSFIQKKFITPEENPAIDLLKKILTGDTGDGVPNICSDDDALINEEKKQTPFQMKKRFADFKTSGIMACKNDIESRNFNRNRTLIDFDYIPKNVKEKILNEYNSQIGRKPNKMKMLEYFMRNDMKLLVEVIGDF